MPKKQAKKPVIVCEADTRSGLNFMESRLERLGCTPIVTKGATTRYGEEGQRRIFLLALPPDQYQRIFERREA